MTLPPPVPSDAPVLCAGYIRVSLLAQAEGHSPQVQRDAIKRLAQQEGYVLAMVEEDHERGSTVSREGYQRIMTAVREGRIGAILVFIFDRWGRDGGEWITRARELERLRVPLISVQEGRDEPGIIRFVRAGMAEEFSRQLARKVRPAKEAAAWAGIHQGLAPYGYVRIYPPFTGGLKRPRGVMEPDPATAWVVRELFDRYATGSVSIRDLLLWVQTDPRIPPKPGNRPWTVDSVYTILTNPTYTGQVRYNLAQRGMYERAEPGSVFLRPGVHAAIISEEVYAAVATHLQQHRNGRTRVPHGAEEALGRGLLRCAQCGGPLTYSQSQVRTRMEYRCVWRINRRTACTAWGARADLVHDALVRAVGRLRTALWTAAMTAQLTTLRDKDQEEHQAATRALESERERLRRHTRALSLLQTEPTAEQLAAFSDVAAEIGARIRALEARLTAHPTNPNHPPGGADLRRAHAELTAIDPGMLALSLWQDGQVETLRALLLTLVASARIVERVPETPHAMGQWLRVEVEWTPLVARLLALGALRLEPAEETPRYVTSRERRNAKRRQERAARHADGG